MLYRKNKRGIFFNWATLILSIFILLCSCSPEEKHMEQGGPYYDLKGFVNGQIVQMAASKVHVRKRMVMEGKNEILSDVSVNWKKELELFVQADLNKKAYGKSYAISRPDSVTYNYTLKKGENLPVQNLHILLDSVSGKPRSVHAFLFSKNRLYESKKDIAFTCTEKSGRWMISSYQVSGYQKLAFMKKREFKITGTID